MAVYDYRAIDADSSAMAGTIAADTPRQARDELRDRGLTVTQVSPAEQRRRRRWLRRSRRDRVEATAFLRELSTLLTAGIPLLPALRTLHRQHRRSLRKVVQGLADKVSAGSSLAEAMGQYDEYFDEFCVNIVGVGEETGSLDKALQRLAEFREKAHRLRSRVGAALLYPAVVLCIGIGVALFLMTYVVPNLLETLRQADRELPAVTSVVKGCSDFLIAWWWLILLSAAGVVLGFGAALRTEFGRTLTDRVVLKLPLIGELVRKETTARLAVVLGALLSSGLQFVQAVRITRRTLRNRVFRRAMDQYEAAVTAGSDISEPLERSGVFSPVTVQMLAVGQQSGQLEDMLGQLAAAYEQQVAVATQRLTAALEPLLIVILAVLVGFIAFATILPILEASHVLQ